MDRSIDRDLLRRRRAFRRLGYVFEKSFKSSPTEQNYNKKVRDINFNSFFFLTILFSCNRTFYLTLSLSFSSSLVCFFLICLLISFFLSLNFIKF